MSVHYHHGQKIEYIDRRFYVDGVPKSTPQVAKLVNLPGPTLACRMAKRMELSKALTMPYQTRAMQAVKTNTVWPQQGLNETSAEWLRMAI